MTAHESEAEVREAFAAQITRANLHHIGCLCAAGMAYVLCLQVVSFLHPIPLHKAVALNNAFELLVGGVSLVLVRKFRIGALHPKWPRVFVIAFAALLLSDMTVNYFSVLSVYGHTSVYVVGVMITAVAVILPPRIFVPMLLINHGVFLAWLGLGHYPAVFLIPAATDTSAGVLIAALASWFLYRAHWGNFCQERVISAGAVELQARNRELARLHLLELDETAAARLAEEKARLEVLRYQLNPHFLFNALTSICAQLPTDPERARATIERLADFCQLTLFRPEGGAGADPTLEQELKMISAYLDIEQTRWGDLLKIGFELEPGVQSERLPPFVLLPLVENALKYGRATSRSGLEIRVAVRREEGCLLLEISNTGRWVEPADRGSTPSLGIGLENLRQRLQRYYPGSHDFTTTAADGWVRVRLRLALSPRLSVPVI